MRNKIYLRNKEKKKLLGISHRPNFKVVNYFLRYSSSFLKKKSEKRNGGEGCVLLVRNNEKQKSFLRISLLIVSHDFSRRLVLAISLFYRLRYFSGFLEAAISHYFSGRISPHFPLKLFLRFSRGRNFALFLWADFSAFPALSLSARCAW